MKSAERRYLIGIFALGFLLRCLLLQGRSIQYDDAFSILISERSLSEIVAGTAADTMPPLYYFLLHFWMMVSRHLWWLRLLSVVLNMASIALLYSLVTTLLDRRSGLWAAFLAAIAPVQIYHAQDLRMYALLAFCQIAYLWFFGQIWVTYSLGKKSHLLHWAGLVVSGMLAMYSHNLAGFLLVAPNLFLLFKRQWRLLGYLCLAQVGIGLLALPWLWMVPGQVAKIQSAFWTPRPGVVEVLQTLVLFTASLPLRGVWLPIAMVLSLQVLVMVVMELAKDREGKEGLLLLVVAGLTPPFLLFIISYVMRPVFVPRGFLVSALIYAALAGRAISRSWERKVGALLAGSLVIASMISLPYQITFREFPRSPFAEAVEALESSTRPGDRLIHDNKLSAFPFLIYAPQIEQSFLADEAGSHNDTLAFASQEAMELFPQSDIVQATEGAERVHFVVFTKAITEYQETGGGEHPNLTWLEAHFRRTGWMVFNDLEVYTFER